MCRALDMSPKTAERGGIPFTVLRELCRWNLESQVWRIILAQLQNAFIARIYCDARMVSQIGSLQYCRERFGAKGITLDIICLKPKMAPLYSMVCLMLR